MVGLDRDGGEKRKNFLLSDKPGFAPSSFRSRVFHPDSKCPSQNFTVESAAGVVVPSVTRHQKKGSERWRISSWLCVDCAADQNF